MDGRCGRASSWRRCLGGSTSNLPSDSASRPHLKYPNPSLRYAVSHTRDGVSLKCGPCREQVLGYIFGSHDRILSWRGAAGWREEHTLRHRPHPRANRPSTNGGGHQCTGSPVPGVVRRSLSIARSIRCQTAKLYRLFLREPRFRWRLRPFCRPQKTRANMSAAATTISGRMAPIVVPLPAVP